jgi:hypothetical protein
LVSVAVWILTAAVAAGTGLALWHLRASDDVKGPSLAAGVAHGIAGAGGLVVLLLALRGPARGVDAGVGSFGPASAILLTGALVTGLAILSMRRKAIVIAIHTGIAITGYVLLLAWDSLG